MFDQLAFVGKGHMLLVHDTRSIAVGWAYLVTLSSAAVVVAVVVPRVLDVVVVVGQILVVAGQAVGWAAGAEAAVLVQLVEHVLSEVVVVVLLLLGEGATTLVGELESEVVSRFALRSVDRKMGKRTGEILRAF